MESLDGTLAAIKFHRPSKWSPAGIPYLIGQLSNGMTVKGNMWKPVLGANYRFWGEVKEQRNGYGHAFEFETFDPVCAAGEHGIESFLAAHIDGIGVARAKAIVGRFGETTLDVLRSNPEIAADIPGITETHTEAIRTFFEQNKQIDPVAYSRLVEMFREYKISKKVIRKLIEAFKSDAPNIVLDNPYILLEYPRVGWNTTDSFALDEARYEHDGDLRHKAAVLEAMARISNDGHTCATISDLLNSTNTLLGCPLRENLVDELVREGELERSDDGLGDVYQLREYAAAEHTIANLIKGLSATARPYIRPIVTDEWAQDCGLADEQVDATRMMEEHGVMILCGGPGTGKTTTLTRFLSRLRQLGIHSIRVCAPTGKAAKRAKELMAKEPNCDGIPSTTIHRALGPTPSDRETGVPKGQAKFGRGRDEFGFVHNEGNPLDEHVIIVDEMSMVDSLLAAALLKAIKPGTRLVIVGDHNQLPSVGPGSVLRDLMAAGIPCAELTEIRRSDGGGTVVKACHAIKDGIVPTDADAIGLPTDNWVHLEIENPQEIAAKIVELHTTVRTFDPMWEMQVVSAQKGKLPIGCENLNRLLSRQLNPESYLDNRSDFGFNDCEDSRDDDDVLGFKRGDKVIRKKNGIADELVEFRGPRDRRSKSKPDMRWGGVDYVAIETPVVNGDMGTVLDIVTKGRTPCAIVRFRDPDRLCRLPLGDHHCIRAYAITVHSCVHPDTYVETDKGWLQIKNISQTGKIDTDTGVKPYHSLVVNQEDKMLRITTENGYQISVTPDHKFQIWDGKSYVMKKAKDISSKDFLQLKLGTSFHEKELIGLPPLPTGDVRAVIHPTPSHVTEDVAEFFGLMVSDGTIYKSGFRLIKQHSEVTERFRLLCQKLFSLDAKSVLHRNKETPGYEINSTLLVQWLLSLGGMSPKAKDVPDCIMQSPLNVQAAFLRGLFEDGWVNINENGTADHIGWYSAYPKLMSKVRMMLLRLGIISSNIKNRPRNLAIYGCSALRFANLVGFITPMKQSRALTAIDTEKRYCVPLAKHEISPNRKFMGYGTWDISTYQHALGRGYISRETAKKLIKEKMLPAQFLHEIESRMRFHHVRIKKIEEYTAPSMCVEVPEGHKFIQNGFVGSNSQGSGFKYVIVPVHHSFYWDARKQIGLFNRELLYTAISRAEVLLVTVGQYSAIAAAVGRKTVHQRKTTLVHRIKEVEERGSFRRAEGVGPLLSEADFKPRNLQIPA